MKTRALLAAAALALAACGGSDAPAVASFELREGAPWCDAPDDETSSTDAAGAARHTCWWRCVTYGGEAERQVLATWVDRGAGWEQSAVFVEVGDCR